MLCVSAPQYITFLLWPPEALRKKQMLSVTGYEVIICNSKHPVNAGNFKKYILVPAVYFFPHVTYMYPWPPYLHLGHVDRFVDENPRGRLIAGRDGDGALVSDVTGGVRVEVGYVQAHQ